MYIELKQAVDKSAQSIGLDKYGKSKMPGCFDYMQAGIGSDKRWVTGIDENSLAIRQIPDLIIRAKTKEEVKERREFLENQLGLDLKADLNNTYWEDFLIKVGTGLNLDLTNPVDLITYYVLLANNYAAPDITMTDAPEYINCKFYMSRLEEEQSTLATKRREKDKATSKLYSLYDNKTKLILIGKYILGTVVKDEMSNDTVYNMLSDYLASEKDKKGEHVRKFLSVCDKTTEEMNIKIIVLEAIGSSLIKFREGLYQRGNITYGTSIDKVIEFISKPENAIEVDSLLEELKERKKGL